MDESSRWFSLAEVERAYINGVLQHAPNLQEAASVLGTSERHLYDLRHEHKLFWQPPQSRHAGWLAPSAEVLEMFRFLLEARRTGKTILLPMETLLRWIKARPELVESFRPWPSSPSPAATFSPGPARCD